MKRQPFASDIVIGLAGLALAALLVGCGSNQARVGTEGATTEDTTPAATAPDPAAEAAAIEAQRQALEQRERELAAREQQIARAEQPKPAAPAPRPAPRPAPAAAPKPAPAPAAPPTAPRTRTVELTVPEATALQVEFVDPLSSETSVAGDAVRARVVSDVLVNGYVAIPAGSELAGTVAESVPTKKIGGQAKIVVAFEQVKLPEGVTLPVQATFERAGKKQTGKDAATIGGATAGGIALSRLIGKGDKNKETLIGAAVGAAVGSAIAAKNEADPVNIEAGAPAELMLAGPVTVQVVMPV